MKMGFWSKIKERDEMERMKYRGEQSTVDVAKGYITRNKAEAEEFFTRWTQQYGDVVTMRKTFDGRYEVKVESYRVGDK